MTAREPEDDRPTVTPLTRSADTGPAHATLPQTVGPYRVGAVLGRGGMGVVAEGLDERSGARVALKFMPDRALSDDEELQRVEREARLLQAIHHPNLALLLGIEDGGRAPVLVLELVEGETLSTRLQRGALAPDEARAVVGQVASAVAAAHARGVIHRDLKPGNVKLSPDGAKVLDFGLASRDPRETAASLASEAADLDAPGRLAGTPGYMAPEQVRGEPPTPAADAWALGCILHECLTGRRAFDGADLRERLAATLAATPSLAQYQDEALRSLVAACLDPDPARRPSAAEVARALGATDAPVAVPRAARLPRARSRFVGRRSEIADLRALAGTHRLTTLTGAGGTGKTRLALEVALALHDHAPAERPGLEVAFVELAALSEPAGLASHVAAALGVTDRKGVEPLQALLDSLAVRDALIVLDNCEHVLEATARLVAVLLESCPDVTLIATSREPLRVPSERVVALPPLRVPVEGSAAALAENESVALFVDRARQARRGFRLGPANAADVGRCCRRLDGMPLAIELAAARLRHVDVHALAAELDASFDVLTGGSPAALPRHQALRATIEWSVRALTPREATLHRRLGVFAGPFTLAACEDVASGGAVRREDVLATLVSLQEKSLVQADPDTGRFRLLEPIRSHASEELQRSGESPSVALRLVSHVAALLERNAPRFDGAEMQAAQAEIEAEHAHVVEAVRLAGGTEAARRLLRALGEAGSYFVARTRWREGRELMDALLADVPMDDGASRAPALLSTAQLSLMLGDAAGAERRAAEAVAIFERLGLRKELAEALNTLAQVAWERVRLAEARAFGEASLALRRELGLVALQANSLNQLGLIARSAKDFPAARDYLHAALAILRVHGSDFTRTVLLINLASVVIDCDDLEGARPLLLEALDLAGRTQSRRGEVFALLNLAQVELRLGRLAEATAHQRRAAPLVLQAGDRSAAMALLLGRARVLADSGLPGEALTCLGAALAVRDSLGAARFHDQESVDSRLAALREELGNAAVEEGLAHGRRLSFEEALRVVEG